MRSFRCLIPLAFIFAACTAGNENALPAIPLVEGIISDNDSDFRNIVKASAVPERNGDIVVIGTLKSCLSYSQKFVNFDNHDNVDASRIADGLRDFSGERVSSIVVTPSDWSDTFLRDCAVRHVLCALDTTYHLSPYDLEGLGHKDRAKLVVVCDPAFVIHGRYDIGRLFGAFGTSVPIVNPFETAVKSLPSGPLKLAVMADPSISDSTLYSVAVDELRALGETSAEVVYVAKASGKNPLKDFLDGYMASGCAAVLDAVIVADPDADFPAIVSCSEDISSVMSSESLTYGKSVSPDFSAVSCIELAVDHSFVIMRELNLFTHNIALPMSEFFHSIPHPESSDHSVILVPFNSYVQN